MPGTKKIITQIKTREKKFDLIGLPGKIYQTKYPG